MATKNYLDMTALTYYDEKLKAWVTAADEKVLKDSKDYSDSLGTNYDPAGTAQTKVKELANGQVKTNTDAIAKLNGDVTTEGSVAKAVADSATTLNATIDAVEDKAEAAQDDVDALETLVGTLPTTATATTVVGYIDEKTANIASDATVNALAARVTTAEGDIDAIEADYLKAADKTELQGKINTVSEGLADVKEDVDAFLAAAEVGDAAIDTLKEIQDYIASDGAAAATMTSNIAANATAISDLDDYVGDIPEGATATDVVAYVQEVVGAEQTRATGVESGLNTRLAAVESAVGESGSVATDIATAKAEAISTAAADATTKANTAETNAKTYADGLNTAMDERVDALEADTHTHANKTVLDGITADKVTAWNAAEQNAKDYADTLNTAMDARMQTVETKSTTNATDISAHAERLAALEDKVGEGFTAITEEQIDALFAQ